MKTIKLALDDRNKTLFEDFMKDEPDGQVSKITYNVEKISSSDILKFGGNETMAYHVLLDGTVNYRCNDGDIQQVQAGEGFYCELEDLMEVQGDGKILSMIMEKGIRGTIRTLDLEKEKVFKIGEAIGESCMVILPLDGEIHLECDQKTLCCECGSAVILRMNRKEFLKVRIFSENRVRVVMLNSVKMFDSDFSSHIGVRTIEQGYGHCKVRLDIKKEHMNPIGSVHGGCLFTMADEASGIAASTTGGICTTVDSHIEFLNAAINVKYLIAEAKPKKIGKKIRTFTVDIRDEKETLICSADFVFYSLQN